jgi:ferritin
MTKSLISEELRQALINQIGHEKYNANLYLYIAAYLKNKGLDNLAKHFEDQHSEETDHSLIIYKLLTDLNATVSIPEIDEINIPINTIIDIASVYLDREILTTDSLIEIKQLAIDENNAVVEERMREMIKLQQAEYEEATTFQDKATLTEGDWKFILLWDGGGK